MTADDIKNEASAVKTLGQAIARYAEQVRDAGSDARRDMAAIERSARDEVERRRAQLKQRELRVDSARAALRSGNDESGRLRAALRAAEQARAEAAKSLGSARKASTLLASAQSDLAKALQQSERVVGEHSSVASSALASLEARLSEITGPGHAGFLRGVAIGVSVAFKAATAAPDLAPVAGDFAAALGHENPFQHTSVAELREDVANQEIGLWADGQVEHLKRMYKDGRELEP